LHRISAGTGAVPAGLEKRTDRGHVRHRDPEAMKLLAYMIKDSASTGCPAEVLLAVPVP
jgi:hypothetical protein